MNRTSTYAFILLLTVFACNALNAQSFPGPKSIGYANAFVTQSRGTEAIGWNPANLGYSDNPNYSLSFGLTPLIPFPNTQINNNALSFRWFNEYIGEGGHLDNPRKNAMMSVFPASGFNIHPALNTQFLGYSYGYSAISLEVNVEGNILLPVELLDMFMYGNKIDQNLTLGDFHSEAQAVAVLSFAQARTVQLLPQYQKYFDKLYVGGGIKLLGGGGYAGTESLTANFDTRDPEKALANSEIKAKYAVGGFGMAFDLGAAIEINPQLHAGVAMQNLFGFIQWNHKYAETYHYSIQFDSDVLQDSTLDNNDIQDQIVKADTSYNPGNFTTPYPAKFLAGVDYEISKLATFYLAYEQGFSDRFSSSKTPKFSLATKLTPLTWFVMRSGVSIGGKERLQFGGGIGLHFSHYSLDLSVATLHGFFNHSQGVSVAFGQQIYW